MNNIDNDLLFLREKLNLLGEPELPASLTAEALFRRMDEGAIALPGEEEPEPDQSAAGAPDRKIIPWALVAKRGIPLAACLALVVFLYQSGGSFGNSSAPMSSSAAASMAGAAPQAPQAEAEAPSPEVFRSAHMDGEESGETAEDNASGESGSGGGAVMYSRAPEAEPEEKENPATGGGGNAVLEEESDAMLPDTGGDGEPEDQKKLDRDQALETQMLDLAAQIASGAELTPALVWWQDQEDGTLRTKVAYQNGAEETVSAVIITFGVRGEEDAPVLEFLSAEQEERPGQRSPGEPLPDSMEADPGTGE